MIFQSLKDGKMLSVNAHSSWKNSLILTTDQQTLENSTLFTHWKALDCGAQPDMGGLLWLLFTLFGQSGDDGGCWAET